jgi:hypothetical protein
MDLNLESLKSALLPNDENIPNEDLSNSPTTGYLKLSES